jgi:tRNA A-37 threonylcarbamoyl transferase component Bud32
VIGAVVGSYRILSVLGEGGMGSVYLGEHVTIGRRAAIKLLRKEVASHPEVVQRFFNEARAANLVAHPSIVAVYDHGQSAEAGAFLVMELLEGESLGSRLRRGVLEPAELAFLVERVASPLAAAHARGIVHRDLKPDNIFLVPDPDHPGEERVKILDFGIAKLNEPGTSGVRTQTGTLLGTPFYMSPEQCHGAKAVDHRTDVYALGVIAFEALVGRVPFLGDGFGVVLAAHLNEAPPAPRALRPELPEALERAILRALAKAPADRQRSVDELAREVRAAACRLAVARRACLAGPVGRGPVGRGPIGCVARARPGARRLRGRGGADPRRRRHRAALARAPRSHDRRRATVAAGPSRPEHRGPRRWAGTASSRDEACTWPLRRARPRGVHRGGARPQGRARLRAPAARGCLRRGSPSRLQRARQPALARRRPGARPRARAPGVRARLRSELRSGLHQSRAAPRDPRAARSLSRTHAPRDRLCRGGGRGLLRPRPAAERGG